MAKAYHIIGKDDRQGLMRFLSKNGQVLLPLVERIEPSKLAVDDLIEVLGRAPIEAVLRLSAGGVGGKVHRYPFGLVAQPGSLLGLDQCH